MSQFVSSALGLTRRFFSNIPNHVAVRSGASVLKQTKPEITSWVPPQIKPFDTTGLYYSREEQIKLARRFRLKLRGKNAPKKGQGKKSQMKKKK